MSRRGALLLEVLLALALFIGVSLTLTRVLTLTLSAMQTSRDRLAAADIARTAMSQIEAGIARPSALQGPASPTLIGAPPGVTEKAERWTIDIETERSSFDGLTLVAVTASRSETAAGERSFTLRQLVRLGREAEDEIGEEGELLEAAERGAPSSAFPSRSEGGP